MAYSELVQKCLSEDIEDRRDGHIVLRNSPPNVQTNYAQQIRAALSKFESDENEDDLWQISELLYCLGYITCRTEAEANKAVLRDWIEKAQWSETIAQALCALINSARPDDLEWLYEAQLSLDSRPLQTSEKYPDPDQRLYTYFDFIILKVRAAHGCFDVPYGANDE